MGVFEIFSRPGAAKAKPIQGSQPTSRVARLIAEQVPGGQAVFTDQSARSLIKNSWEVNPYVFAGIDMLGEAVPEVPLILYRVGKGETAKSLETKLKNKTISEQRQFQKKAKEDGTIKEVEVSHPWYQLQKQPNPTQTWDELVTDLVSWYKLTGDAFLETCWGESSGLPLALYSWNVERTQVLGGYTDRGAEIGGYRYTVRGTPLDVEIDAITHWKTFNPSNDFYGFPPLKAAALASDTIVAGSRWNVNVLQNSGKPSGILTVEESEEGAVNEPALEKILTQVRSWIGFKNAGKPAVIGVPKGASVKWTPTAQTAQELDWLRGVNLSLTQVAIVLRIPSILLGDANSKTFNNYSEARKAFYQDAVFPLVRALCAQFQRAFIWRYGPEYILLPNFDAISAVQEEQAQKAEWLGKTFGRGGISQNEFRFGLGFDAVAGGERFVYEIPGLAKAAQTEDTSPAVKSGGCNHESPKTESPFDRY